MYGTTGEIRVQPTEETGNKAEVDSGSWVYTWSFLGGYLVVDHYHSLAEPVVTLCCDVNESI